MHKLEQALSRTENMLTFVSALPVLGSVSGACKFLLGTVQTVTAIAFAVLGIIPRRFGHEEMFDYAVVHLKNGLGNIVSGALETIPLVGTVVFLVRVGSTQKYAERFHQLYTVDETKLVAGDEAEKKKETANKTALDQFMTSNYSIRSQLIKFYSYPSLQGRQYDDSTAPLPDAKPKLAAMPVEAAVVDEEEES